MLKINLGAGGKPHPDYVNVDMVLPVEDDGLNWIKDDVMVLSEIEDNSVDEMIAYHLIEHLPEVDVNNTLMLWNRKLKPGGKIAIECPDLMKCCINFLQYATRTDDQPEVVETIYHRLGIIGIYGEPSYTNKYMQHCWGYTPETLSERLHKCGFTDIKETKPISKPSWSLKRDMRIEASKPL